MFRNMQFQGRIAFATLACLVACSNPPPPASPAAEPSPATVPVPPASPAAAANVAAPSVPDYVRAAVDAPDRSAADRALDAGRKPDLLLAFFGIRPGMRVAELGAGGGYTSELLARVVGSTGKVYVQNSAFILERFANGPLTERLAKPELTQLANVVRSDRPFDDPLPAEVKDLDAVLDVLFYHDTVWQGVDREKMNRAVFAALKSGGVYGIVDHSALPGSGLTAVESVHRIEEKVLREEIERAGFRLVSEGSFLKNPSDTRDWSTSPRVVGERRGTSDRFVLKFQKP
ncbi:MAG TPA: SAM-dependent methyltransferase [Polyangiaceae bacterium]|nr:SAM-dependent methyltransferase [Polyangiaceae bacterium]